MTTVGGNNVGYGGGYYEAQIVYTLSYPSDAEAKITWERRVYHSVSLHDSTNDAGGSGDLGGSNDYGARDYSASGGGYKSYETGTKTVARQYGSSVHISDTFWVEDLAEGSGGGARSSVTASFNVSARPYTTPSAPHTLTETGITSSGATLDWVQPNNWGGNDTDDYELQYDSNSSFSSPQVIQVTNASTRAISGLAPNDTFYWRVRAKNTAGNGAWSGTASFNTKVAVPNAPVGLSETSISHTSTTLNWPEPTNWGGNETGDYDVQYDSNSSFSSPATLTVYNAQSKGLTGLTPGKKYYWRVRAFNSAGKGTWSGTGSWTTSSYNTPAAPTSVLATRNSDAKQTVTWTRNATSSAPYTSQTIQRQTDAGEFVTLSSSLSGSSTSYVDTSTSPNHEYQYRVKAVNSAGSSPYGTALPVWTTPATPNSAKAVKNATNGIVVTWKETVNYVEIQTEIWESIDGGANYTLLTTVAGTVLSYTHAAPDLLVTHKYRLRHKTTTLPTLYSGYAYTDIVQLAAPPFAPTNLSPNGIALDATQDIHATWVHNSSDSSPQTKWQGRHRVVGAPDWVYTGIITSSLSEALLLANTYANGLTVEWEIQTWGVHVDPSPWSATAVFYTSTPPNVTITSPLDGEVVGTSALTVTWTYFDAEGSPQTGWMINLIQDDNILESRVAANEDTSTTFDTPILDGATYTITAQVRDGVNLLSAVETITITVDYLEPAAVLCDAVYDELSGTVLISLQAEDVEPGVTVEATSASVERRIDGGAWLVIAQQVPPNGTVLDLAPGIHNTNEYRVTVYSDIPSSAVMEDTCIVETCEINRGFLSTGLTFENIIVIDAALGIEVSTQRDKAVHHFAGRRFAVEFMGTAFDKVVNVTGTLYEENGTATDLENAAQTASIVLWRDPTGRRLFGSIGPVSTSLVDMAAPHVWTTGFPVSEVDYAG